MLHSPSLLCASCAATPSPHRHDHKLEQGPKGEARKGEEHTPLSHRDLREKEKHMLQRAAAVCDCVHAFVCGGMGMGRGVCVCMFVCLMRPQIPCNPHSDRAETTTCLLRGTIHYKNMCVAAG